MLLLATVLWGLSFPLMKALPLVQRQFAPGASDWFLVFLSLTVRFGGAAVVLLPFQWRALARMRAVDWKLGVGLGLFAGIGILLQMAGLLYTLASTSGFLTQLYALLIPLTLAVWRRRWPPVVVWMSCGLVLVGMAVLCGVSWQQLRIGKGEWLTLLGSVAFTAQILWLDRREFAACDKTLATLAQFATIGVMLAPFSLGLAAHPRDCLAANNSLAALGMLTVLALGSGLLAFWLMNTWQPQVHPTHAGLIYCAEPIFVSVYALFLPEWLGRWGGFVYANEQLTAQLWIGGALITLANVLIQFARKPD
jgi:drug/metabolite transporter (DMT)-like permease